MNIDVEAVQLVADHARGDGFRTIGRRLGVSHEQARRLWARQNREHLDNIELALMVAAKYEAMGRREDADWPVIPVPFQDQTGWQAALALLQATVDELRRRDVPVRVHSLPTPAGTGFALTLDKPLGGAA